MRRRQCTVWGSVVCLLGMNALPAAGQSLADVARLAREAGARAVTDRVYTDEDLPAHGALTFRRGQSTLPDMRALRAAARRRARERERLAWLERSFRHGVELYPAGQVASTPREPDKGPVASSRTPVPPSGSASGGIPLSWVYSSVVGPLGSRGRNRQAPRGDGERPPNRQANPRHRPPAAASRTETVAPRPEGRAPARNGYAESSRPFDYVAPGLPHPQRGR